MLVVQTLMSYSIQVYLFLAFSFFVSGLILRNGIRSFSKSNRVKNTGTEKIRSMAMGKTEIKGRAVPIDAREKPFTDGECVRAEWEIEEYRSDGDDDSKNWETIASGQYGDSFLVNDDTEKAYIDVEDGEPDWKYSEKSTQEWDGRLVFRFLYNILNRLEDYPKEQIESFEKENDLGSSSIFTPRRYTQKYIEVEEDVYVLGETKHRDGKSGQEHHETYKIGEQEDTGEFIVSGKSEEELKKDLRKKSAMYIIGSAVMFVASLYVALAGF